MVHNVFLLQLIFDATANCLVDSCGIVTGTAAHLFILNTTISNPITLQFPPLVDNVPYCSLYATNTYFARELWRQCTPNTFEDNTFRGVCSSKSPRLAISVIVRLRSVRMRSQYLHDSRMRRHIHLHWHPA
jgi:hypothetical protein